MDFGQWDIEEEAVDSPAAMPIEHSTAMENFGASIHQTLTTTNPITSRMKLLSTETEKAREKQLYKLYEEGKIEEHIFKYFVERDQWDELGQHARNKGHVTVPLQSDYEDHIKQEFKMYADMAEDTYSRATGLGKAAAFGGGMVATMLDPLYAGTMPFGYGQSASALKAILGVMAVETGVEAIAQPFIWNWNQEIDQKYSVGTAFTAIATTAIASGALTGVVKGLSKGAKGVDPVGPTVRDLNIIGKGVNDIMTPAYLDDIVHTAPDTPIKKHFDDLMDHNEEIVNRPPPENPARTREATIPEDISAKEAEAKFNEQLGIVEEAPEAPGVSTKKQARSEKRQARKDKKAGKQRTAEEQQEVDLGSAKGKSKETPKVKLSEPEMVAKQMDDDLRSDIGAYERYLNECLV